MGMDFKYTEFPSSIIYIRRPQWVTDCVLFTNLSSLDICHFFHTTINCASIYISLECFMWYLSLNMLSNLFLWFHSLIKTGHTEDKKFILYMIHYIFRNASQIYSWWSQYSLVLFYTNLPQWILNSFVVTTDYINLCGWILGLSRSSK